MRLYEITIFFLAFSITYSCSCDESVAESKTRKAKYIIIDGEKVEVNALTDTSIIIIDTLYYKNKTIPRKYLEEK